MRTAIIYIVFILHITTVCRAQDTVRKINPATGKTETFTYVDQMPYPAYNLEKYIASHTTYPDSLKKRGIKGKVAVQFLIKADGSITLAKVIRHLHPVLDTIALHIIQNMPKWKPAIWHGRAVDCMYSQLIEF